MLDCMHKFRARGHKISTPRKISTPSSRYGFSHDLHVFFFDVYVENTGMTLAFRLAWSVLCCGHENRVRTRVTRGSGQPKKKILGRDFLVRAGPGISNFFWSRLMMRIICQGTMLLGRFNSTVNVDNDAVNCHSHVCANFTPRIDRMFTTRAGCLTCRDANVPVHVSLTLIFAYFHTSVRLHAILARVHAATVT